MPEDGDGGRCEVCGAAAARRCGDCKQVVYCGPEHQRQDWKQHKATCRPYQEESSPELGRHLVATRDLRPGDLVLREAPLVIGPKHHSLPRDQEGGSGVCLGCHRPVRPDSEFRCPRCLWPVCGPDCPADGKAHTAECAVLRSVPRRQLQETLLRQSQRYEVVTPLRCLLLQRRSPARWQQLLGMESHEDKRGPGTDAYREGSEIADLLLGNYPAGTAALEDCSKRTIRRVLGVLDVNGLDVLEPGGAVLVALYPATCLLEHSCLPNTRHSFELAPGPHQYRITVTAATHIARGEHISTMYTHVLWGTQARQDHLRATKYFNCRCRRCADPTELGTHFSTIKCLAPRAGDSDGATCGGIQLPALPLDDQTEWRCDTCPMSLTAAQVSDLVTRIGDEVDNVLQGGPTVKQLEGLLTKLETFLHPHHYHCYAVKHSLVQLYGHQHGYQHHQLSDELLRKKAGVLRKCVRAAAMCRELLRTTEALDPGCARLVLYSSVLQYELARALARLDSARDLSEALALLQRAAQDLRPEPELSPGRKMMELVETFLRELRARIRQESK